MSTISSFQPFSCSIYQTNTSKFSPKPNLFGRLNLQRNPICSHKFAELIWNHKCKITRVMSSEEDTLIPERLVEEEVPVAIPVSPADRLIMFFQAEGTMNELAIPSVTQALEDIGFTINISLLRLTFVGFLISVGSQAMNADANLATSKLPHCLQYRGDRILIKFHHAPKQKSTESLASLQMERFDVSIWLFYVFQGTEGISDLKVHISEGIATVELTKQTTIQATGVASGLLEAVQGAGFRLNTLNLSFEDEELLTV
ncbi:hypothetical protein KSS87_011659 [Heliosperma pusillum]|nr:hypothetical protein KSS87_011659 [Heliosperma pusillum]